MAPLSYHPNEQLVAELGLRPAQQHLRKIFLRAVSPGIRAVYVTEEEVRYPWPPGQGTRIAFADITAVDIYPNRVAIIYGPGRQVLGTVVCATDADTQELADLLMSFQTRALQAPPPVPSVPSVRKSAPERVPTPHRVPPQEEIALERVGPSYVLPVEVNGELIVHFIVDPRAVEVSVAPALVRNLYRTGLLTEADFLPGQAYRLPEGETLPSGRFVFASLKIGTQSLEHVTALVRQGTLSFVIGQEVLNRLGGWRIDTQRQVLVVAGQGRRSGR